MDEHLAGKDLGFPLERFLKTKSDNISILYVERNCARNIKS